MAGQDDQEVKLPDPVPYEPPKDNFADQKPEEKSTYSEKKNKESRKKSGKKKGKSDQPPPKEEETKQDDRPKKKKRSIWKLIAAAAVVIVVLIAVCALVMTLTSKRTSGKTMATDDANLTGGGLVVSDGTNTYISLSDGIYLWSSEEETLLVAADEGVSYQNLAVMDGTLFAVRVRNEALYDLVEIDTTAGTVTADLLGASSLTIISLYNDTLYFLKNEALYSIDADREITQTNLWHAMLVSAYGIYTPNGLDGETALGLRLVNEDGGIEHVFEDLDAYKVNVLGEYEDVLYISYGDPSDESGMLTLATIDLETYDLSNVIIQGVTQAEGFHINFYGDEIYIASYLTDEDTGLQCSVYAYDPDSETITTLQERSEGVLFSYTDAEISDPRIYITDYYAFIVHPGVEELTIDSVQVVELD